MKKTILGLVLMALMAGTAWGQAPVITPGWTAFVIHEADDGTSGPPLILDNDFYVQDAVEMVVFAGGQKAGLGTNQINGYTVADIANLHVDRLDDPLDSGSLYGPYFNIWVTDGLGQYAVIANEPSNPEWGGDAWDVADWDELRTKTCKVYETPGAGTGTSWVHTYADATTLTFEDVAGLVIEPPSPAYIADGANLVGAGAPDELGTDVAYGYNWIFGDTMANYVSGTEGFVVANYAATTVYNVHNATQDTYFPTIQGAVAAANPGDWIDVADGGYFLASTLALNDAITIVGESEGGVQIHVPPSGYAIAPRADDVVLRRFTLVTSTANGDFPIKASGTSNPPGGFTGLELSYVTVAKPHARAGVDVHAYNDVVLSHVTSLAATAGNGIQLTGVVGADLDNITTANNAWGSIAIYCSGPTYLNRPCDDVVIDGATLSVGEDAVFIQDEFGLVSTDISVTGYAYEVRNTHFREAIGHTDSEGYTFLREDLAAATAMALSFTGYEVFSSMEETATGDFTVVPGLGIQAAVDAAAPGATISVAAGTYEGQVYITTNDLKVIGAGVGSTIVAGPATTMPNAYGTTATYPVIGLDGTTGCEIAQLTVDGQRNASANNRYVGVGLWNSGGWVHDVHITGITHNPFNGTQGGNGVDSANDTGGPYTIKINDCAIDDIQKTGLALRGTGLTVDLDDITVLGQGVVTEIAQNGLQLSPGVTGTVDNMDISGFAYLTGTSWVSTGALIYGPGPYTLNNVNVSDCEWGMYTVDYNGTITGGSITDPAETEFGYGVGLVIDWYASAKSLGTGGKLDDRAGIPQPDLVDGPAPNKLAVNMVIDGVTFSSTVPAFDTRAIQSWSNDVNTITVQNCDISGYAYGGVLWDNNSTATGDIVSTWTGNSIVTPDGYGIYAEGPNVQEAADNWWGSASGPYHPTLNPSGQGSAVSDFVNFEPWSGMAGGTITPSATGPLNCSETVTLTFNFVADASTPDLFLFDAVVSATPGLDFGTITNLYPFGSALGTYTFYAQETGPNQWTITGGTFGFPTNPVTADGETGLFSITFSAAADVVGDVVFESLTLRDPTNATIPVNLSGAAITYDCTAPAAVTGITAAPGHRKVDVAWTHDGTDVDHYAVFSGQWYDTTPGTSAYPEYDDLAGFAEPSVPSTYAVAAGSNEWDALPDVAVGTNATAETWTNDAGRGVYAYTVFAVDAAGNVSPAPAALDEATNYWLGDVNSAGDAGPDGIVSVWDINDLGTHFGEAVPLGATFNVLDVGPTDDWSRLGIPTTDNVLNFEDLMIFSLNFGVVSAAKERPVVASSVGLEWVAYDNGDLALRLVDGSGLKGVRVRADVPIGSVAAGTLLDEQSELTFLKNVGEGLDVSVAIMGDGTTFTGTGDLFVVRGAGALDKDALTISARAVDNSELEVSLSRSSDTATPRVFALHANYPNPFNPMTKIAFSLPEAQDVRLHVYGVDGRRVATLLDERRAAGLHEVVWTGRNDDGRTVASGVYFCRIEAGPYSQVRKMTLMK